jgi:hypothetical protein
VTSDTRARFHPLRPPTKLGRAAVLLAGPVLWVVALDIVAWAAGQTDLILVGFAVAGTSFLLGVVILLPARALRLREEREPPPRR